MLFQMAFYVFMEGRASEHDTTSLIHNSLSHLMSEVEEKKVEELRLVIDCFFELFTILIKNMQCLSFYYTIIVTYPLQFIYMIPSLLLLTSLIQYIRSHIILQPMDLIFI